MDKSTTGQVFNIADLEKEIEAEVRNSSPIRSQNSVDFAPRRVREPTIAIPDYVEHNEGATEIGKLSAEAVVREYEAAAKEIEEIGGELIERVKQCEAMTLDALAVTEELKQTAQRYRGEAKRVFHQIENCTLMTAEVRKTCTELKERLTAPAAAPA
jgi:chromatin segregation and condensation protein Rec8/ScpA/Scc1 (kleisin family)